jgi:uncharacterized integral membrane protein
MKSVKPLFFSLVIIFVVLVVVQNVNVFMDERVLRLNLWVWRGESPPIPLSVYFLGFLLIGLLISYFYGLGERFKAKKTIQNHLETVRKQEEEIKALKSLPLAEEKTSPEESESA